MARNLRGFKFTTRALQGDYKKVLDKVSLVLEDPLFYRESSIYKLNSLPDIALMILMERRIISPDLAQLNFPSAAVIFRGEESSFTINDEDHIRIRAVSSGREVNKVWKRAEKIYRGLSERFEFAYSSKLGYLTCSPAIVGTGLNISFFCHLPALSLTDGLEPLFENVSSAGISIRGYHDEQSQNLGNIYHISNQITLGVSEEEILQRMDSVLQQVVEAEQEARQELIESKNPIAIDRVRRSFAVLQNAHLLGIIEFISFISAIRLGLDLNMITGITHYDLNKSALYTQPGHMLANMKEDPSPLEVDEARASMVRKALEKARLI